MPDLADVAIIGGGINGAGLAWDLSSRGWQVALFEKNDFASGTSSQSSKLIHGGLRYLEHGHLPLVFEALKERSLLLKLAAPMVRPLAFQIPIYQGKGRPKWKLKVGLWLYDLLSLAHNIAPHKMVSKADFIHQNPFINPTKLQGGARYYDAQMDDARLCLMLIRGAAAQGAQVHNYQPVTQIRRVKEFYEIETQTQDGKTQQFRAKAVVNAGGVWTDPILTKAGIPNTHYVKPSKGIHIVVNKPFGKDAFLLMTSDSRVVFIVPWHGATLIGTTDTTYDGPLDDVKAEPEEIAYLLAEVNAVLTPDTQLNTSDVTGTFAGLRPLINFEGNPKAVTREHQIIEKQPGFFSVFGGKYTTFRVVAEDVAKHLCDYLNRPFRSVTADKPIIWEMPAAEQQAWETKLAQNGIRIPAATWTRWQHMYGHYLPRLLELFLENPDHQTLLVGTSFYTAEVIYAIRHEYAKTPEDFLRRRTVLQLLEGNGKAALNQIADLFTMALT